MAPSSVHSRLSTLTIIGRDVGVLLVLLGVLFALPLAVALLYGKTYTAMSFLAASGVSAAVAGLSYWACRDTPEPSTWQGMLSAAARWPAVAVLSLSGVTDALFSGFEAG